jgi:hypothetical protein
MRQRALSRIVLIAPRVRPCSAARCGVLYGACQGAHDDYPAQKDTDFR